MNEKRFFTLSLLGSVFIYALASLLHFTYDLSGGSALSVLFGAVNESVWEHVKIFSFAFITWSFLELLVIKPPFKKYVTAKVLSLYFLTLSIIVFFYTYTTILKKPILLVDLISSAVFVVLSQYISYLLTTRDNNIHRYFCVALFLLSLALIMLFSFTIFPPKIELFKDPVTNRYGLDSTKVDVGAIFLDKSC